MKRFALLAILLIGAFASYAAGFEAGVILLIAAGAVFELAFWVLALRGAGRDRAA